MLNMSLSLLSSGIVNIFYDFADEKVKTFEVPRDIIDINKTDLMKDGKLSDYVTLEYPTAALEIVIKYRNTTVWRL